MQPASDVAESPGGPASVGASPATLPTPGSTATAGALATPPRFEPVAWSGLRADELESLFSAAPANAATAPTQRTPTTPTTPAPGTSNSSAGNATATCIGSEECIHDGGDEDIVLFWWFTDEIETHPDYVPGEGYTFTRDDSDPAQTFNGRGWVRLGGLKPGWRITGKECVPADTGGRAPLPAAGVWARWFTGIWWGPAPSRRATERS